MAEVGVGRDEDSRRGEEQKLFKKKEKKDPLHDPNECFYWFSLVQAPRPEITLNLTSQLHSKLNKYTKIM